MNKANILALADFMESAPFRFTMSTALNVQADKPECGSAGCIAGHAARLWPELRIAASLDDCYYCSMNIFRLKLKLKEMPFESLVIPRFETEGVHYAHSKIDKPWAIRVLRHLAETGEVDWRRTKEDSK